MIDTSIFKNVKMAVFDFDGVFTDNSVYTNQEGVESVRCSRSDGLGIERLKALGIPVLIVSTEINPVVTARAKKLKIECYQSVQDKAEALLQIASKLNVDLNKTMFVGNDINDLPALKIVGLPVAVADAYPEILPFVRYVTKKTGGNGAVREVCDLIYQLNSING